MYAYLKKVAFIWRKAKMMTTENMDGEIKWAKAP